MLFETGDLVLLRFPFTGQTGDKQRPALVLLDAGDDDLLVEKRLIRRTLGRLDEPDWVMIRQALKGILGE